MAWWALVPGHTTAHGWFCNHRGCWFLLTGGLAARMGRLSLGSASLGNQLSSVKPQALDASAGACLMKVILILYPGLFLPCLVFIWMVHYEEDQGPGGFWNENSPGSWVRRSMPSHVRRAARRPAVRHGDGSARCMPAGVQMPVELRESHSDLDFTRWFWDLSP